MPRSKNNAASTFARRLTQLRKSRHLTQAEFAEQIGMVRGVIAYYESSAKNPTVATLQRFADFFNVSPAALLEEETAEGSKPGPSSKLDQLVERVRHLSPTKQKVVVHMLEGVVGAESLAR
jgi:transcriptional regulator with XRE-family HTH domain